MVQAERTMELQVRVEEVPGEVITDPQVSYCGRLWNRICLKDYPKVVDGIGAVLLLGTTVGGITLFSVSDNVYVTVSSGFAGFTGACLMLSGIFHLPCLAVREKALSIINNRPFGSYGSYCLQFN